MKPNPYEFIFKLLSNILESIYSINSNPQLEIRCIIKEDNRGFFIRDKENNKSICIFPWRVLDTVCYKTEHTLPPSTFEQVVENTLDPTTTLYSALYTVPYNQTDQPMPESRFHQITDHVLSVLY